MTVDVKVYGTSPKWIVLTVGDPLVQAAATLQPYEALDLAQKLTKAAQEVENSRG